MTTVEDFIALARREGTPVIVHRESVAGFTVCPCRTPEGFRDPEWHVLNPLAAVCDEEGKLRTAAQIQHVTVRGFVQPIQSSRATRLQDERLPIPRGEVQADDHLAILPVNWEGSRLDFYPWPEAGQDYVEYNGRRFQVVNANLIPGPGGVVEHHWEIALRLRSSIG